MQPGLKFSHPLWSRKNREVPSPRDAEKMRKNHSDMYTHKHRTANETGQVFRQGSRRQEVEVTSRATHTSVPVHSILQENTNNVTEQSNRGVSTNLVERGWMQGVAVVRDEKHESQRKKSARQIIERGYKTVR